MTPMVRCRAPCLEPTSRGCSPAMGKNIPDAFLIMFGNIGFMVFIYDIHIDTAGDDDDDDHHHHHHKDEDDTHSYTSK